MNELHVEDNIGKPSKGDIKAKRASKYNKNSLSGQYKETTRVIDFRKVGGTHILKSTKIEMSQRTEESERVGALTSCKARREGLVRMAKARRGTHFLLSAEGGTRQDSKRNPASAEYSPSVKYRGSRQEQ
jgi:hypothetical protein